ncbi:MAG: hypothetical protein RKP20_13865 [Candidatus Competibacter sp.]|nr:hypothetical protein [Candidatus Competibacter sp.]
MLVDTDVLIWHLRGYTKATQRLDQLPKLTLSAIQALAYRPFSTLDEALDPVLEPLRPFLPPLAAGARRRPDPGRFPARPRRLADGSQTDPTGDRRLAQRVLKPGVPPPGAGNGGFPFERWHPRFKPPRRCAPPLLVPEREISQPTPETDLTPAGYKIS